MNITTPWWELGTVDRAHILAALGIAHEKADSAETAAIFLALYRKLGGAYEHMYARAGENREIEKFT